MIKLSELQDDQLVSHEDATQTWTAAGLKEMIEDDPEYYKEKQWHTVQEQTWKANAKAMIESHIDDEYCNMFEDWDQDAIAELNKPENAGKIDAIQELLDSMFDSVSKHWTLEQEIDINN